jgi:site-specific DNA recombinase
MTTSTPRRAGGRTLIDLDPDELIWVLLARESTDRERQLDNQLTDLRAQVAKIGGRIDREIPENAVSAFKRQRVALPDGTFGYRVVRPEWENILTALRRGECNALMVPDIDRAMRDPRTLEDLIDVVEYYGVYVASLTGNIDLTTDSGISAARSLVNQRNQESRNTSRRVIDGQRHAAMQGGNHSGRMRPFGINVSWAYYNALWTMGTHDADETYNDRGSRCLHARADRRSHPAGRTDAGR